MQIIRRNSETVTATTPTPVVSEPSPFDHNPGALVPSLRLLAYITKNAREMPFGESTLITVRDLVKTAQNRVLSPAQQLLVWDLGAQCKRKLTGESPESPDLPEPDATPARRRALAIDAMVRQGEDVSHLIPHQRTVTHFDSDGKAWWDPTPFAPTSTDTYGGCGFVSDDGHQCGPVEVDTRKSLTRPHIKGRNPYSDTNGRTFSYPRDLGTYIDSPAPTFYLEFLTLDHNGNRYTYMVNKCRMRGDIPSDCRLRDHTGAPCGWKAAKVPSKPTETHTVPAARTSAPKVSKGESKTHNPTLAALLADI